MTILITDHLGKFLVKEKDMTWQLRDEARKTPLGTLFKVRSGQGYHLLLKIGRNNFLDMHDKVVYRPRQRDEVTMTLAQAGDVTKKLPVHDFHVQIAKLVLK